MLKRLIFAFVILSSPAATLAFDATLQTVFDGDTVDVLDANGRRIRIRLSGIDAPERAQPFGEKARDSLQRLLSGCPLNVVPNSIDRYQRMLAKVTCAGRDAGFEQIRSGAAWFYPWTDSISQSDRVAYALEEQAAKAAHRGLWSDRDPIPPWQFRRAEAGGWPDSFKRSPSPGLSGRPLPAGEVSARIIVLAPDAKPALNSGSAKPVTHKAARHPK